VITSLKTPFILIENSVKDFLLTLEVETESPLPLIRIRELYYIMLKCKRGYGIGKQCVLKVIDCFYLQERKPCYYSREGGQCTECIGHTRFCEARLADGIRGWQWSLAFLAVQIHGCSRGAAAWIQPHCSSHTGRVRVVKTHQ